MKRILFILLLTLGMKGQITVGKVTIPDDALHFYASCIVNDVTYSIQGFACPKWRNSTKLIVSDATTLAVGIAKEMYDKRKAHPTGFSKEDLGMDVWSIPVYTIFRICLNHYKKDQDLVPIKYYYFDNLGQPTCN